MSSLTKQYGYPVDLACQAIDLPHSSYYYQNRRADDSQLQADIKKVLEEFPCYGTRRVFQQLRRPPYNYQISRKRVRRVMQEQKWLQKVRKVKVRTTNSGHPYPRYANLVKGLEIIYPNQVWVADVTYIRLGQGFVYLAILLDVYTRAVRGWHLSKSCDTQLTLRALHMGLSNQVPTIHHTDQGGHYAAHAYMDELKFHQILISMAEVGKPEENGYAERFMRTVKEEEVDLSEYQDFEDVYNQIGRFIMDVYNKKRIHSALGYLTPHEFEAVYLDQSVMVYP